MIRRDDERPGIFISYRRSDSSGYAGRLSDSLQAALGDRIRVFMDVDTIGAGVEFANALETAVDKCQVLYALIGPTWVDITNEDGVPRLSDSTDWVRREIATALTRDDVRVVPVLVGGSTLPKRESLPPDLQALVGRQEAELHASSWRHDVDKLIAETLSAPKRPPRRLAIAGVALVVIAAIIGLLLVVTSPNKSHASAAAPTTTVASIQPVATTASVGASTDNDPRAQIVKLTGQWSVQGFVDAIVERDADIVDKYLKSGMMATTSKSNASAILYGFQGDMNNDPVALIKTFRANGYKLNDDLTDGRILQSISDSLPLPFDTKLTPKNYTGGYQDGKFTGSLLFWIVSRASFVGVGDQDRVVLKYLISQGADCSVARSYLDFNREILDDTAPFKELYPMIKSCAH